MARRSVQPFPWLLFSAGGVMAALFLPALLLLFALVFPLGLIPAPSHEDLHSLLRNPLTLLVLFGVLTLSLFHWAHRFRYALRDGLQLQRVDWLIAVLCYGAAVVGTLVAASALLNIR
jgi:fumarate reductase subunit D